MTSSISIYIPKYYACLTKEKSFHWFTWNNSFFFFYVMYSIRNEDALLFLVITGTWQKHQEFCVSLYPFSLPSIFSCSPKTTTVVMVNNYIFFFQNVCKVGTFVLTLNTNTLCLAFMPSYWPDHFYLSVFFKDTYWKYGNSLREKKKSMDIITHPLVVYEKVHDWIYVIVQDKKTVLDQVL